MISFDLVCLVLFPSTCDWEKRAWLQRERERGGSIWAKGGRLCLSMCVGVVCMCVFVCGGPRKIGQGED